MCLWGHPDGEAGSRQNHCLPGILGFLQPTRRFWETCDIIRLFEMITVGQDKNDSSGRQKHYQTVHTSPAHRGEPYNCQPGAPWAPFLKRKNSFLLGNKMSRGGVEEVGPCGEIDLRRSQVGDQKDS